MQLRSLRQRAGLTQDQLAQRVGRSQAYVSILEAGHGRKPSITTLTALCDALDLTVEERERLILSFFAQAESPAPAAVSAGVGAPAGTPDTEQMFQFQSPAGAGAEEAA